MKYENKIYNCMRLMRFTGRISSTKYSHPVNQLNIYVTQRIYGFKQSRNHEDEANDSGHMTNKNFLA